MTDAITTLNLQLETYVKELQIRLAKLNALADAGMEQGGKELRHQIDVLEAKAKQARASVSASTAVMQKWIDDSVVTVDEWRSKLDVRLLEARAERSDDYAKAASDVAIASVDAAEQAALHAKLAHADVHAAKAAKAA